MKEEKLFNIWWNNKSPHLIYQNKYQINDRSLHYKVSNYRIFWNLLKHSRVFNMVQGEMELKDKLIPQNIYSRQAFWCITISSHLGCPYSIWECNFESRVLCSPASFLLMHHEGHQIVHTQKKTPRWNSWLRAWRQTPAGFPRPLVCEPADGKALSTSLSFYLSNRRW